MDDLTPKERETVRRLETELKQPLQAYEANERPRLNDFWKELITFVI